MSLSDAISTELHIREQIKEVFFEFVEFFSTQPWLAIFIVILSTFIAERLIQYILKGSLKLAEKTKMKSDDLLIEKTIKPARNYVVLAGSFLTVMILSFSKELEGVENALMVILKVATVINTVWFVNGISNVMLEGFFRHASRKYEHLDNKALPIIQQSLKVFFYVVGVLYLLRSLGYSITGVLTGLGIGGLAVAMAAKDTLSNFFGTLAIFTDQPYRIGDWIIVNGHEGVVEEVGFRSTRIRTFAKTLITVPNSTISTAAVNNYSRMPKRRVKMTIGVTYSTTRTQMEELVDAIRYYLKNHEKVNQEYLLVNFTGFGDSALEIFLYYFTSSTVWEEFLDTKQEINLAIMAMMEERGIEFAFPTQTVHLASEKED